MAATYGWPLRKVRDELTDEQFVLVYLAPAERRMRERSRRDFESHVEATRLGAIFARDRDAFRRWTRRVAARAPARALTPEQLESAVMRLAGQYPGNVVRVTA